MKYKFIDIGCAYFATSVDDYGLDVNGILVEPIKYYADLLPKSSTVFVENSAIANHTGTAIFNAVVEHNINEYYPRSRMIEEYETHNQQSQFKYWYEGGQSSFVDGHNKNAEKITVNTLSLKDLFAKYDVHEVDVITMDTEGYDLNLLRQLFHLMNDGVIQVNEKIVVEYYEPLYSVKEMREFNALLKNICEKFNFDHELLQEYWNTDMILTKRVLK